MLATFSITSTLIPKRAATAIIKEKAIAPFPDQPSLLPAKENGYTWGSDSKHTYVKLRHVLPQTFIVDVPASCGFLMISIVCFNGVLIIIKTSQVSEWFLGGIIVDESECTTETTKTTTESFIHPDLIGSDDSRLAQEKWSIGYIPLIINLMHSPKNTQLQRRLITFLKDKSPLMLFVMFEIVTKQHLTLFTTWQGQVEAPTVNQRDNTAKTLVDRIWMQTNIQERSVMFNISELTRSHGKEIAQSACATRTPQLGREPLSTSGFAPLLRFSWRWWQSWKWWRTCASHMQKRGKPVKHQNNTNK